MMLTLHDAEKIVALFKQLDSTKKRLAEIEDARANGTGLSISFKLKNREGSWGDIEGVKYGATFQAGKLNDIAAIVLARLSDEVAAKKRQIERDLIAMGGRP